MRKANGRVLGRGKWPFVTALKKNHFWLPLSPSILVYGSTGWSLWYWSASLPCCSISLGSGWSIF